MRKLSWVLLYVALSVQMVYVFAEEPAQTSAVGADAKAKTDTDKAKATSEAKANADLESTKSSQNPPTASLSESSSSKDAFKMGDSLEIKVEGKHGIKVANSKATGVWLVLDDVIMKSIGEPTAKKDDKGNLILSFRLSRDATKKDSRDEWKHLLEKQDSFLMTLPISLAIGSSEAMPVVIPNGGIKFSVTTETCLDATLIVGLFFFVLVFLWLINYTNALKDKPDGLYSLGKSQMAFWGLLVFFTFCGIWINTGSIEHISEQVLILIGISGGTGLSALLIGNGEGETKSSIGFLTDICNDGNGMSFHRLQTVMWTVILGVIFIFEVARVISMPEFDTSLLTLLGISNGIYLGFKFPEQKA